MNEPKEQLKIDWAVADLTDVVAYWVEGYTKAGFKGLESHAWYLDVAKGKLILKLYVRTPRAAE